MSIFGRSVNSLQIAQVIREQHDYPSPEYNMMERVVLRTMTGFPSTELDHSYAGGVRLNDLYDALAANHAPYCLEHDEKDCPICHPQPEYEESFGMLDADGRDFDLAAKDGEL